MRSYTNIPKRGQDTLAVEEVDALVQLWDVTSAHVSLEAPLQHGF